MAFHVGQKVVCIGGQGTPEYPYDTSKVGEVYTVSNTYVLERTGELMLELVELYMSETDDWEAGELASFFRPAVERKTDISALKALLNVEPEKVSA